MTPDHGKFVWYELMTTDTAAAESFYRSVIGWTAQDAGMPDMAYTLFSAGDAKVAGLMAIPERILADGGHPFWMGHVAVDDVDATAALAKQQGGAVHREPTEIPGVGRFAVLADPQGAVLCVFKPSMTHAPAAVPPGTPGHVGWRELYAADWQPAFAFYEKLFGWTKADAIDMGAMGVYQLFAHGGTPIGGMMTKPPTIPRPFWGFYFNVDSLKAAIARVEAGNGKIVHGPQQVPGGSWIAQGLDPQGAGFNIVSNKLEA
jgi:uncharacterized protein